VLDPDGSILCDERASLDTTCSLPIPFGFNGMWRSDASGLSYMRNRWYSPQLAQFMSHDPLEYIDSYNLYAFATLDPVNFWDPWGLSGGHLAETGAMADAALAGFNVGVSSTTDGGTVSTSTPGDSFSPLGQFIRPPQNTQTSPMPSQSTQASAQQASAATGGSRYGVMGVPFSILAMNQKIVRTAWLLNYLRARGMIHANTFRLSAAAWFGISKKINPAKQARHLKGAVNATGSYLNSLKDARLVLDAVHSGKATFLGITKKGHLMYRYQGVTGVNVNIKHGYEAQKTNVFMIKGIKQVSVVPSNPNWKPPL